MMTLRRGCAEARQVASKSRRSGEIWRRLKPLKKPQRKSRFTKGPIVFSLFPGRAGHQADVDLVELLRITIELDIGQTQVPWNLTRSVPANFFAVACSL